MMEIYRIAKCISVLGILLVSLGLQSSQANAQPKSSLPLADLVERSTELREVRPPYKCIGSSPEARYQLRISNGMVVEADLVNEISGYARAAGTTGGYGGRLRVVTTLEDYDDHDPPIPGSLRAHLETAKRNEEPAWIVFDEGLPARGRLLLKRTLRIPSNVTIDGACTDIVLEAPYRSKTMFAYVADGVENVIISRLSMRKIGYVPELYAEAASAIMVNGRFDRVAIISNDLSACGHSCIDITVSPNRPLPTRARISVLYNFIHDNDKAMLFGTYNCPQVDGLNTCDESDGEANRRSQTSMYLTLEGNVFVRTGQRNPRIFGRVTAHILNNLIAFRPLAYADGRFASSYGIFVSNGARALVEGNLVLPLTDERKRALGIWTVGTPGALRVSTDVEGFIRLGPNVILRNAIVSANKPQNVERPDYAYAILPLEALSHEILAMCLLDQAGRSGRRTAARATCER